MSYVDWAGGGGGDAWAAPTPLLTPDLIRAVGLPSVLLLCRPGKAGGGRRGLVRHVGSMDNHGMNQIERSKGHVS